MKFLILALVLSSSLAYADITPQYRYNNSVVLYNFEESSGNVIYDRARPITNPATGQAYAPINLNIQLTGSANIDRVVNSAVTVTNGQVASGEFGKNSLQLYTGNNIRSVGEARKLNETCRRNGSFSLEMWIDNTDTVDLLAGMDIQNRPHTLRIFNLSRASTAGTNSAINEVRTRENLYHRNFVFGQFYENGNIYQAGLRTPTSEPSGNDNTNRGRSLSQAFETSVAQTIVPDISIGRPNAVTQKIVYTVGPSGVQKIYLSDLQGNMYLAQEDNSGFVGAATSTANLLSNWDPDAYLSLGNVGMTSTEFTNESGITNHSSCVANNVCRNYKNRFWKGRLRLVAAYCNEIPREEVLGLNVIQNIIQNSTTFNINTAPAPATPAKAKALEIFNRITGAKGSVDSATIQVMENHIVAGRADEAALEAMKHSGFLNVTVRDFAAVMSNREQNVNTPLNDFIATVIGYARDDKNASGILSDDIFYAARPGQAPVPSDLMNDILRSNNHYNALSEGHYDLGKVLGPYSYDLNNNNQQVAGQFIFDGSKVVKNDAAAGLLTTRTWMMEHAIAGTNRRLVEYTFKIFLCSPLESIADTEAQEDVIGPDIDRQPGGDPSKFRYNCQGCHTILDGFRPAFSFWTFGQGYAKHSYKVARVTSTQDPDFDENAEAGMHVDANNPYIAAKINRNSDVFPEGRHVKDDSWVNNAVYNSNAKTLFPSKDDNNQPVVVAKSGRGTASFGRLITSSPRFARCMAERAFKQVCKRSHRVEDNEDLDRAAKAFKSDSYKFKTLFKNVVASKSCLGG